MRSKMWVGTAATLALSVVAPAYATVNRDLQEPAVASAITIPLPFTGRYGAEIEPYSAYDGQTKCSSNAKPGVVAFANMLRKRFGSYWVSIKRSCAGTSVSEHKEGRAIDWGVNAYNPTDKDKAQRLLKRLLKTDWWGNEHAMARRLGIMYIIWNKRMWRAYRPWAGWQPYEGSNPHTNHMHISFARAGGLGLTSYWTGKVYWDLPAAWIPQPPPPPVPTPTPIPTPTLPVPTPTPTSSGWPWPWPSPIWHH